jgi:hypothetical protein
MSETGPSRLSPKDIEQQRTISDLVALWTLCHRNICRKAGRCRGTHEECLCYMPEVPEKAREWAVALVSGAKEGLSFDDARARIPNDLTQAWLVDRL